MEYLTWKKLKERIEKMSEEEQNQSVKVWGDDTTLCKEVTFDVAEENLYWHDDFDYYCCLESELDSYTPEECTLVAEKGTHYLYV